jgi:superfamily II DNA helicase RecQ
MFSPTFLPKVLTINDKTGRNEHKSGLVCKVIYKDMSEVINTDEPEYILDHLNTSLLSDHDLHSTDPYLFGECNPAIFAPVSVDGKVVHSLINKLNKFKSKMKAMMQVLGTHKKEPVKVVDNAKEKANTFGMHKFAVCYFYYLDAAHPNFDSEFQPFMSSNLKGSSDDMGTDDKTTSSSVAKKARLSKIEDVIMSMGSSINQLSQKFDINKEKKLAVAKEKLLQEKQHMILEYSTPQAQKCQIAALLEKELEEENQVLFGNS